MSNTTKLEKEMRLLNLGRFNRYVEHLPEGAIPEYPTPRNGEDTLFFYTEDGGRIESIQLPADSFCVPTFTLGMSLKATEAGDRENKEDSLMAMIELKAFQMIMEILTKRESYDIIGKLLIPVRDVKIEEQNGSLYAYAELGIALIV